MVRTYFKTAWRSITKNRVASFINILGLTLGIATCLTIYLDLSFELSFEHFQTDQERIYRVVTTSKNNSGEIKYKPTVPDPMAATMRSGYTGIEKVAQFHSYYAKVTIPVANGEPKTFDAPNEREEELSDIIISDIEYFDIFKYQWIAGDASTLNDPFHVVLTETKAKKYFGSVSPEQILGREIIYDDSLRLLVSGIVSNYPRNSDFIFNDFIASATVQRSFLKNHLDLTKWQRWNKMSQTFIKATKGTTLSQFQKQAQETAAKYMDVGNGDKISITLQPLSDIHFNINYEAAYGRTIQLKTLYGLMVIAMFILLIAVVNFINLSTAQSLYRAKEIGVRKVLGSSRLNLVLQFLCETFILTSLSVMLSLIIASPIISAFHSFLPIGVELAFAPASILFIILITLATTLLAGFYPAKVLSAYAPALTLKGVNFRQGNGRNYLRKGLIIFQFTISLIFIIGTFIIGNQIKYVLNADLGFTKKAIINIHAAQGHPKDKMLILAQQFKNVPGVEMVSVDLGTPAEESHWSTILKSKETGHEGIGAQFQAGDEKYIQLYQLRLLAGRNLLPSDTMREYLINETLSRQLGFKKPKDAIGKTISSGGDDGTASHKQLPIVGVLADFHSESLHESIAPTFISTSRKYSRMISVKLLKKDGESGNFSDIKARLEKIWKIIYPNTKFEYKFFDETIAKFYEKEQKTELLMNTAMGIAIFISCMGLFGLVTFESQKRTKEIGIRKVLGASVINIVSMLSKDFLKLVLLAFVVASPIAYYFMNQWLQDFVYRTNISWWVFILSVLGATAIALVTISFQAIKAGKANPVSSLRSE